MFPSEKTFTRNIKSQYADKVLIDYEPKRSLSFDMAKELGCELSTKEKKVCFYYEVRVNDKQNRYPDLSIFASNKMVQIEYKNREKIGSITDAINAMAFFNCTEFWFVLNDDLDIAAIKQNVENDKVLVITETEFFSIYLKQLISYATH